MKYNKNYFIATRGENGELIAKPVKAANYQFLTYKPLENKIKLFITKPEYGKGYILNEYTTGANVGYFDTLKQLDYNIQNTDLLERIDCALSKAINKDYAKRFMIAKQNRVIEDLEIHNIWDDLTTFE